MRVLLRCLGTMLLAARCGPQTTTPDAGTDAAPGLDATLDGTPGDANPPSDAPSSNDAGCGAGALSELSATAGAAVSGSIAHAGNGNALAAWMQFDTDVDGSTSGAMYAAEHQGCAWGPPAQLKKIVNLQTSPQNPPMLAANDSTFVLLSWTDPTPQVWTGSGVTPASGTFTQGVLGTDGTTFVDVMYTNPAGYTSSTSTDGMTWSSPVTAETTGTFSDFIASGPYGVLAWAYDAAAQKERVRLWHQGTWSAPALLGSFGYTSCVGAVGNADAVVACLGPYPNDGGCGDTIDVQLFDGSWHDLPPPTPVTCPTTILLATDGTDYRLDYKLPQIAAILHAGAWSTTVTDKANVFGTAGRSGAWTGIEVSVPSGYSVTRASGLTGFPMSTSLVPQPIPIGTWVGLAGAPFTGWPGRTDVAFVDLDAADGGVKTFYVALDL